MRDVARVVVFDSLLELRLVVMTLRIEPERFLS